MIARAISRLEASGPTVTRRPQGTRAMAPLLPDASGHVVAPHLEAKVYVRPTGTSQASDGSVRQRNAFDMRE